MLNHRGFFCRLFYIRLLKTKSIRIEGKNKTQQNLPMKTQALSEKQRTALWNSDELSLQMWGKESLKSNSCLYEQAWFTPMKVYLVLVDNFSIGFIREETINKGNKKLLMGWEKCLQM